LQLCILDALKKDSTLGLFTFVPRLWWRHFAAALTWKAGLLQCSSGELLNCIEDPAAKMSPLESRDYKWRAIPGGARFIT
jgi:hypothetical protein